MTNETPHNGYGSNHEPQELPPLPEEARQYIADVQQKITHSDAQLTFSHQLELLKTISETYLNARTDALRNNTGAFFTRYAKALDKLLRDEEIETSPPDPHSGVGPIANKIEKIYKNLVGFKAKATFEFANRYL